ncbi:hypothetical protein LTR66_008058 [Elasticomyces elasticus]|nr:hypothetical protein LTR66_008058 [Elasticomyces elasticus]KAK4986418.1 hypothetical protein LTR50_005324 [Elasticomyces elasticus]KAK5009377.1 hypothetical protein LTR28_001332 [Elasticomyces elasticus]
MSANQRDAQQQPLSRVAATTAGTLSIALENQTFSSQVYAYIAGQALDNNNALFLLQSDGQTAYYPSSPSGNGSPLLQNVAIALGAPGNVVTVTIPRIAGGRIWFSVDSPLTFLLNPGDPRPGLVEPSATNPSDPNFNVNYSFAEFTFNESQLFANISYVDFVGIPIALTLQDTSGASYHVSGMPADGLATVCAELRAQTARDGRRWSSLIYTRDGQDIRALSPNNGIVMHPDWFATYWTPYVQQVYSRFASEALTINTQAAFGDVTGRTGPLGNLNFGDAGVFAPPSSRDIFSCSTGPFATGDNAERNTIIPRLAAAFNRSTLLLPGNQGSDFPNGVSPPQYYTDPTTNHYSRIVHAANLDHKGYAFPYDDVAPDGGVGQEGAVMSGTPTLFTVTVGGRNAYVA